MPADPAVFTLFQVGLLIVVASICSELFRKSKLPGVIGAILVGLFIGGPGGLGLIRDVTVINLLASLGAILILFTTGVQFDASSFWKVGKTAFLITTIGVILSILLGYGVGLALGFSWQAAFLLGAVLAPSGTSVVAAILSYEGIVETKIGSTLLTAVILDDIEGILILTIALSAIAEGTFSASSLISIAVISSLFILVSIYIGSKILPFVIKRLQGFVSDEFLFIILLGLGLMLAFAATMFGLAAITGAFIMGAIIPYPRIGEKLAEKISMMKELFAAIFFTSIGLAISPIGMAAVLPVGLIILGTAILARLVGGLIGGYAAGFRGKTLWAITVGLAVRAEMSFIIAYEGVAMGIVAADFLTLTAIAVIGSMIIVLPLFLKLIKDNQELKDQKAEYIQY
ncbi:MAG: cation:proton antiporter [Candidatus Bathyarchaeota archaeon]|nr:cation:proton antiporter [Candidatus Bathyarchaeota archaeon]